MCAVCEWHVYSMLYSICVLCIIGELESFEEHLNTLFKVVHVSPITTSIQVCKLIQVN